MSGPHPVSSVRNLGKGTLLIFVLVGSVIAGTSVILVISPEVTVGEPLNGSETGQTWTTTLYPGQSTDHRIELSNYNSSVDYIVKVEIESFDDVNTGLLTNRTKAVAAARDGRNSSYIKNIAINGSHGYHVDLLNDGVAYYNTLPTNSTESAHFTLRINEDVRNYGQVSVNLSFERVKGLKEKNDLYHQDAGVSCTGSACHATNKSVQLHQEYNISKNSECGECHGRSFQDTHMTCTGACHDSGYPIEINSSSDYDHGPDSPMGVSGNYYCSENCHGTQISSAHTIQFDQYCGACHSSENATVFTYHSSSISDNCLQCHGMRSEDIHARYKTNKSTVTEYDIGPNNQCTACHGTDIGG